MDNFCKEKLEIPVKMVVDSVAKTTHIDVPTTIQQKYPMTKQITEQLELPNSIKIQTSFNIENELEKLKIPIPFTELMSKNMYRP